MNDETKNFLQDIFINAYETDANMFELLGTEENILKLHKLVFGKLITVDEIVDCAQIIGDDEEAHELAMEFVQASNRLEKMFHTVRRTTRQLRREHGYQ